MTKTEKIEDFREKYLPVWAILAADKHFCIKLSDLLGKWSQLTADRYHFDFTMYTGQGMCR